MAGGKLRAVSGTLDQVFSSVGNGLILFAIAVVAATEDFGRIALMFTLVAAALGILRGAIGTPLLLTADLGASDVRRQGALAMGAALVGGLAVSIGLVVYAFTGAVDASALLLAVAVPLVLAQDVLRYVAITLGDAHVAALWDGVWCAGSFLMLIAAWTKPSWLTAVWLVGGWALCAGIALVGLMVNLRIIPRLKGLRRWIVADGKHRIRYGIDAGLEQVTIFIVLLLVATVVDNVAAAAIRGATAALAPLAIVASAIPLVVIPEAVRAERHPQQTWRLLIKVAVITSTIALVVGIILRFLPSSLGGLILGSTYEPARAVIVVMAAQYAASAWITVLGIALKAQNRSADALTVKCVFVVVALAAITVSLWIPGTAWGVAMAFLVGTLVTAAITLLWFRPWTAEAIGSERAAAVDPAVVDAAVVGAPKASRSPGSQVG